ncbi:MAG TPA: Uxx-star family glutaredoxin-like (seleno)protein [Candidatus Acidoferrales bacterium]
MAKFEIYGSARCPHTQEMREWLEWRRVEFIEYDVELDSAARARMKELTGGQRTVPVLVENGVVSQIGWQGHGCVVNTD